MKKVQRKVLKDLQKRIDFQQHELKRVQLLAIRKSTQLVGSLPWQFALDQINDFGGKGSITRVRNICRHTGRSRGILVNYGLSRLEWRRYADRGEIPGVRRASW